MGGNDQDDRLLIPYTSAMKRITGDKNLRSISVQISGQERMALASSKSPTSCASAIASPPTATPTSTS